MVRIEIASQAALPSLPPVGGADGIPEPALGGAGRSEELTGVPEDAEDWGSASTG